MKKQQGKSGFIRILGEIAAAIGLLFFFLTVALASHSADLNGDGKVDTSDLAILKTQWGSTGTADLNHDGAVNTRDAGILFSAWGTIPTTPPPPPPSGTRDPALWPFEMLSPWNRPLGDGAQLATIQTSLGSGFSGGSMNSQRWSRAVWVASSTDPIRKIYRKDRNMAYFERRVPDAAAPSGGTDGHMTVISPDHLTGFEMYGAVKRADGDWEVSGATVDVNIEGSGISMPGGSGLTDGITIAYGGSQIGGVIRSGELRNGIFHRLAFATGYKMWNRNAPGGRRYVWPASSADSYAGQAEPNGYGSTGNLFMGSMVTLPWYTNLDSIGLETVEGRNVAEALRKYGATGTDSSDATVRRFILTYDTASVLNGDLAYLGIAPNTAGTGNNGTLYAPFQRDLDRLALLLKVVTNSHNSGFAPTLLDSEGIGGGTPRAPFAPPFDR